MKKLFCIYAFRDVENDIVELGVRILGVKIGFGLMLSADKRFGLMCGVLPFVRLVDRKEADND